MRIRISMAALCTIALLALGSAALAQTEAEKADPSAGAPAAEPPPVAPGVPPAAQAPSARPAAGAASTPTQAQAQALRLQCAKALITDAQWRAELKQQLAAEVHDEDARAMLRNKKHVVMAYAALWILVTLFVAFMWIKQKDLKSEIARLEREVRAAAKDSKAG